MHPNLIDAIAIGLSAGLMLVAVQVRLFVVQRRQARIAMANDEGAIAAYRFAISQPANDRDRRNAILSLPPHLRIARAFDFESEAQTLERLLINLAHKGRANEDHPILRQVLNVRHRAAGNFSAEFSGVRGEAYDNAVVDVYRELEAYLTGEPKRDRYGKVETRA